MHTESVSGALGFDTHEEKFGIGDMIVGAATGKWRNEECRATYSESAAASGGFLLSPEQSATVIDLARARSAVSEAGSQTILMNTEEPKVAKVETDPTAYWVAENAEITKSSGTFGAIVLRARTLAVYCESSLELMRDAANAGQLIMDTITSALGSGLDNAMLNGPDGSGVSPTGLLYDPDVDSLDAGGDALTTDDMLAALGQLWANDVEAKSVIFGAEARLRLAKMKDGEGRYLNSLTTHADLADLAKFTTTAIESAANYNLYIGDFSNLLIGLRSPIEIELSAVAGDTFQKKQVAIRGLFRADFAVGRADDICQLKNFTV